MKVKNIQRIITTRVKRKSFNPGLKTALYIVIIDKPLIILNASAIKVVNVTCNF